MVSWSSSLWGCELKKMKTCHPFGIASHPPCEDVSWKVECARLGCYYNVILLVRMWVENLPVQLLHEQLSVILHVRMWVEKSLVKNIKDRTYSHPPCEDVSWKSSSSSNAHFARCHPPCEDVSWKDLLAYTSFQVVSHPPCEDVSWKICLIKLKYIE